MAEVAQRAGEAVGLLVVQTAVAEVAAGAVTAAGAAGAVEAYFRGLQGPEKAEEQEEHSFISWLPHQHRQCDTWQGFMGRAPNLGFRLKAALFEGDTLLLPFLTFSLF